MRSSPDRPAAGRRHRPGAGPALLHPDPTHTYVYFGKWGIWVIPSSAAALSRWPAKFGWMAPPSKALDIVVSAASVTTGFAQRDEQLRGVGF